MHLGYSSLEHCLRYKRTFKPRGCDVARRKISIFWAEQTSIFSWNSFMKLIWFYVALNFTLNKDFTKSKTMDWFKNSAGQVINWSHRHQWSRVAGLQETGSFCSHWLLVGLLETGSYMQHWSVICWLTGNWVSFAVIDYYYYFHYLCLLEKARRQTAAGYMNIAWNK